jgi:uncharacterized membrane protein YphA (DoxX/SURF4 family)
MMNTRWVGLATVSSVFLRLALGISFLSAVADRFGLWGVYGQPNVAWGNYARFVAYTAKLNWFLPAATIPALAIIATAAEILFGLLLVLGWKTRTIALFSGVLLTTFALTMTMALGVKAPLDLSVFSAAGGALLLATSANFPFSLDELVRRNKQAESQLVADQGPITMSQRKNWRVSMLIRDLLVASCGITGTATNEPQMAASCHSAFLPIRNWHGLDSANRKRSSARSLTDSLPFR